MTIGRTKFEADSLGEVWIRTAWGYLGSLQLEDWLIGWSVGRSVGWLVGWLVTSQNEILQFKLLYLQ